MKQMEFLLDEYPASHFFFDEVLSNDVQSPLNIEGKFFSLCNLPAVLPDGRNSGQKAQKGHRKRKLAKKICG